MHNLHVICKGLYLKKTDVYELGVKLSLSHPSAVKDVVGERLLSLPGRGLSAVLEVEEEHLVGKREFAVGRLR